MTMEPQRPPRATGKRLRRGGAQLALVGAVTTAAITLVDARPLVTIDWPDASQIVAALPSPQVTVRIALIVAD